MKKFISCALLFCNIITSFLNAMENPPLTQKEIDRLAELMIPISEAQLLDSKDNKEFSELITKLRTQLEKQKEEQKKQTIKRYDITDKQEK